MSKYKPVLGIDGGLKGYVCLLTSTDGIYLSRMPVAKGSVSRSVLHLVESKSKQDYRPANMLKILDLALEKEPDLTMVIEEPLVGFAKGKSSRVSRDSQMRGFGMWCAVASIRGKMLYTVAGATWQAGYPMFNEKRLEHKVNGVGDFDTKVVSRKLAEAFYPKAVFPTGDAADACLIARYFRESINIEEVKICQTGVRARSGSTNRVK